MPVISIIIPTYKPQHYLIDCLDSIVAQTLDASRFEVIIVLNGCDQPYRAQIEEYKNAHKTHNITLLSADAAGVSYARNEGIKHSAGDYVCFVDDDDWLSHNYLQELLSHADGMDIVVSNVLQIDEKDKHVVPHFLTTCFKNNCQLKHRTMWGMRSFFSTACAKIISRKAIGSNLFDTRFKLGEDSLFMFAVSAQTHHVTLSDSNAVYYIRKHSDSVSRKPIKFSDKATVLLKLTQAYIAAWCKHPCQYNFVFFLTRIAATLSKLFIKGYR